jgi:hypothetical protein
MSNDVETYNWVTHVIFTILDHKCWHPKKNTKSQSFEFFTKYKWWRGNLWLDITRCNNSFVIQRWVFSFFRRFNIKLRHLCEYGKALIHCSNYLPFHLQQSSLFLRTLWFFFTRSSTHSFKFQVQGKFSFSICFSMTQFVISLY